MSKRAGKRQAVYPAFRLDAPTPASAAGRYIGRVGVLAATLGVGVAMSMGHGLGVAHADPGAQSSDPAASDDASTDQEESSADPSAPVDEPVADEPGTEPGAAGEDAAESSTPPMQVGSSGGADTSTNDAGQNTDTETDLEAGDTNEPTGAPEREADSSEVQEEPKESREPAPVVDVADAPSPALSPDERTEAVLEAPPETMTTLSAPVVTATTVTAPVPEMYPYVAPNPVQALFIEVPRTVVTIATTIAGLLLTPFLAPGPIDPAQPPLLWVALGWIRHEINRTFFNRPAVVRSQNVALVLEPGEASDPIAFDAYDGDNDALTYHVPERGRAGGPMHGTVTVDQATGTFTYTPDAGYTGPDQFTVAVTERPDYLHMHGLLSVLNWPGAHGDRAKVRLTVGAPGGLQANPDSYSVDEDGSLSGNVLDNDSSGSLSAALAEAAEHGEVTLNADGSFTYTPDADFHGVDTFTYTAQAGNLSDTGTVTITVTSVNDAGPVASDDTLTVAEDAVLTGNVLGGDSDVDGDALTVTLGSTTTMGTLTLNADGSFTYTPDANYHGTDSFTYAVSDGTLTDTGTVTITITSVNDAGPVAGDDSYTVNEDGVLTGNVLGGDTDVDNDTLTVTLGSTTTKGTLVLNADGSFTYTPNANFHGTDSFTYTVSDGNFTDTGTVTITITSVNDAGPVASDDEFSVTEDGVLTGNVLGDDTDADPLTVTLGSTTTKGTLVLNADGSFTYTPNANYHGTDSFTYTVSDGNLTDTGTVTITITSVNDAGPVAGDDEFSVDEDGVLTGNVLGGDTDVDNDTLTVTLGSTTTKGTLVLNADGSFTYTPNANYHGTDSFTYAVSDGNLTDTGTVTITITSVNDAGPVAGDDSYTVAEDGVLTGNVLGGDTDIDGDPLTVTLGSTTTKGTLVLNSDGSFTYTPNANYHGTDSFTYTISDGTLNDTGTVTITITSVNDSGPVAGDDEFSVIEDGVLTGNVLGGDTDADNDTLTVTLGSGPTKGSLTLNADGSFTYTPNANYHGTDSFTYTVSDGTLSDTGTVTITITSVNDAGPVASDDDFTVAENGVLTGNVLGGDTDVDNDTLTVTLGSTTTKGTLVLNADGTFTYTPNANYHGTDSFTYTISDGTLNDTGTVTITITSVNDSGPVAGDDEFTVAEDGVLTGNVLGGDTDADNDTLTVTLGSGPTKGSLTLNADGSFTYTPNANYHGTDSFTYTVSDGTLTDTGTVTITITSVNDAGPVAADDEFTVAEDGVLNGNVLGGDTDVDNDTLTVTVGSGPTKGSLTLNADGSFTYTPNANYHGTDSFTYTVSDGTLSDTGTVTITITSVNDAGPVASDDDFTVAENGVLTGNVLGGDTDVDNDTLTVTVESGPTKGSLTLNPDGSFTYTPNANYHGTDSFTYTVSDGTLTDTGTVTITITSVNDAGPVAADDEFTVAEDGVLTGNVLGGDTDIDGDNLTVTLGSTTTKGTLVLNADGSFTYTPNANYHGTDSFTYTVSDGTLSDTATVTITITSVNDAGPVASDDEFSVDEDGVLTGNVLGGDSDIDGDPLTVTLGSTTSKGTLVLNADGTFTYTPNANYHGTDSFTYTVSDGTLNDTGTVTITITSVNDAGPVAGDDDFTVDEDGVLTGNVLAGDSDVDDDTLTVTVGSGPTKGSLTLNADGSFTYTPNANYHGTDSFTYTVSDGTLTDTGTVTITITSVNDAGPVASDDEFFVNEDGVLNGNVLGGDSDIDNDTLTVTVGSGPTKGSLTLNADGSFTYSPNANYHGTDSFTYTVTDGTLTDTGTVTITITSVNDAGPVASDDSYTVAEDGVLTGNVLGGDTDADNDTLTVTVESGPTKGSLTLNPDGSFTYTPNGNYHGTDSFTYTVTDGTLTDTGTVTITITSVNDAGPIASDDEFSVDEDGVLTGNVLGGDSDIDGDTLTVTLGSTTSKGTLVLNSDGSFTYTPNANYHGTDSFTYTVSDGTLSDTGTITITITSVNDAGPIINGDNYTTAEDDILTGNVLGNDTDVDNDNLTAVLVDGPNHGSLQFNADGSFTYTPNANYHGTDSFTYVANDGLATGAVGTVSIVITAINDAGPVANNDSYVVNEDTALNGDVLANDTDVDNDSLTVEVVVGPTNGVLHLNDNGTFTYTPNANYHGTDSFTYITSDGTVDSTIATVSITVNSVNDAGPVATNDSYTVNQSTQLSGNVLGNDSDVDGDTLTVSLGSTTTKGTLVLNSDGSFTYTSNANAYGTDSFTYTVFDGTLSSTATVTINVVDNVAPKAVTVQTTNSGTNGVIQQGDSITFTFSEAIDPNSIKQGWNGGMTNVLVRVYDGNILLGILGGNDTLQVFDATTGDQLPLGTVELGRSDYATSLLGGALGSHLRYNNSTMVMSGNTITITLGAYSASGLLVGQGSAGGAGTMTWVPMNGPKDLSGNPILLATATESGAADADF